MFCHPHHTSQNIFTSGGGKTPSWQLVQHRGWRSDRPPEDGHHHNHHHHQQHQQHHHHQHQDQHDHYLVQSMGRGSDRDILEHQSFNHSLELEQAFNMLTLIIVHASSCP